MSCDRQVVAIRVRVCKTASFDVQTNNEEIAYAWIKELSLLTQSKLLK